MKRVVLLTTRGESGRFVAHRLRNEFDSVTVVQEQKISRTLLLRGRYRRLGLLPTLGQLIFIGAIAPLLRRESRARREAIHMEWGIAAIPQLTPEHQVESVNTQETRELLARLDPSVVVVNGTRIIGKKTLSTLTCPIVNMHAGITPLYRGVHGAYWALREGRPALVGTTIHLVDEGIDTGTVLEQVCFPVSPQDNFATYPLLQVLHGLPALTKQVRLLGEGRAAPKPPLVEESMMRYHPTAFGYLKNRIFRGVK